MLPMIRVTNKSKIALKWKGIVEKAKTTRVVAPSKKKKKIRVTPRTVHFTLSSNLFDHWSLFRKNEIVM